MKGIATDEAKRTALTDAAFSYITAFGGKLTANDFQTMARRGGTAWMNAKPESIGPLAILAAELGGQSAGQTAMTLQQLQMGANTLSKQQGAILQQAGLLDMSKVTKTGFGGGRLQVGPGGILGSQEYAGDLPGWIKNVVYPHIMAAAHGDDALAQSLISKISPNRNAAKLIEMFGSPGFLDQQMKHLTLGKGVKPIGEAYESYANTNPAGVEAGYEAQKKSMLEAIGAPMMQAAIPVMKSLTDLFQRIGSWANANPETVTGITKAVTAISLAMISVGAAFVGAGIVTAIGMMGPFAAGIVGIGAAISAAGTTYLVYGDKFTDILKKAGGIVGQLVDILDADLVDSITKIPPIIGPAITAAFQAIGNMISNAVKGLVPGGSGQLPRPQGHPGQDGSPIQHSEQHSSLVPPAAQVPVNFTANINLDGRKVASVVTGHMVASATYPTSAAGADSRGMWMGPSWSPTEQG
jgi:hypothetical protein